MNVNSVSASDGTSGGQGTRSAVQVLDKNAFLQLLVAQLKNQNPMNPQDSNEFVSQMAQFSTLEALQNIEKQVTLLAGLEQSKEQGNEQIMQKLAEAYTSTNELLEQLVGELRG